LACKENEDVFTDGQDLKMVKFTLLPPVWGSTRWSVVLNETTKAYHNNDIQNRRIGDFSTSQINAYFDAGDEKTSQGGVGRGAVVADTCGLWI
jgi:hypothetical protein